MKLMHQAIVLQNSTSHRDGYIFFDRHLGTIQAHVQRARKGELARGALVQYYIENIRTWYSITSIEIIAIPQQWVAHDIWFLHHILELIDFFVPRNHKTENIFILMGLLYQPLHDEIDVHFFKKVFLCNFFILTGMYPEPHTHYDREFVSLVVSGADPRRGYFLNEQKYVFLEKKMIQWLQECIFLHPHADRLKTMIIGSWYAYEKNNSGSF